MATKRIPILGASTVPDSSGDCFPDAVVNQLSLASAPGNEMCFVMVDPNGGGDHGLYGKFSVPQDYSGSPVLVIRGILDGAPTTTAIAFGFQGKPLADDEAYDAALATQDIASASSVSQSDEDVYEETITLTNLGTLAAADDVDFFFFIDDSVHTFTGNFLLTGLFFQYADS